MQVVDFTTRPVPNSSPPHAHVRRSDARIGLRELRAVPGLLFPPGASAATFPIEVCGDTAVEADEEIDVRVAAPDGVLITDNDLDLILRNDDT